MPTCIRPKLSIVFCVAGTEKVPGALNIAGNIISAINSTGLYRTSIF